MYLILLLGDILHLACLLTGKRDIISYLISGCQVLSSVEGTRAPLTLLQASPGPFPYATSAESCTLDPLSPHWIEDSAEGTFQYNKPAHLLNTAEQARDRKSGMPAAHPDHPKRLCFELKVGGRDCRVEACLLSAGMAMLVPTTEEQIFFSFALLFFLLFSP